VVRERSANPIFSLGLMWNQEFTVGLPRDAERIRGAVGIVFGYKSWVQEVTLGLLDLESVVSSVI
jgi:hypothetical protein